MYPTTFKYSTSPTSPSCCCCCWLIVWFVRLCLHPSRHSCMPRWPSFHYFVLPVSVNSPLHSISHPFHHWLCSIWHYINTPHNVTPPPYSTTTTLLATIPHINQQTYSTSPLDNIPPLHLLHYSLFIKTIPLLPTLHPSILFHSTTSPTPLKHRTQRS